MDWRLVLLSFGLLIVAELGDKTQLVVFSLVSQYRAPFPVFLGASLALTVLTLIAAIAGQFVSSVAVSVYPDRLRTDVHRYWCGHTVAGVLQHLRKVVSGCSL